jgi:hypothetical protein
MCVQTEEYMLMLYRAAGPESLVNYFQKRVKKCQKVALNLRRYQAKFVITVPEHLKVIFGL